MTRRIAIDIETSGLDPDSGAEIILICAVELLEGGSLGAHFQSTVKPSRPLIPAAVELTVITNEMLVNAPSFAEIADDFLDFIADAGLVCINSEFDSKFLNQELTDIDLSPLQPERFIDLLRKLPLEFREQGSEGIYRYAQVSQNQSAKPSEEVARLYWALIDV
jgi:DNA polymerase-3 subunit epsilon